MTDNKTKEQMLEMLNVMLDENIPYAQRLEAYEYLLEDCEEIVDDMLKKSYTLDGDTGKMLMEVLAQYKGNKAIFMGLVSYLYKGDDVALFAKLIGSYGDEQGIQVLKTFCDEYEPNYNEFMELRNAVEELGGDFDLKEDFSDDPLYRYLKGLDEKDDRTSPFEGLWANDSDDCEDEECGDEECHCHDCGDGCDDECHCHESDDCHCGHHHDEEHHCLEHGDCGGEECHCHDHCCHDDDCD
ncbi:MAG: hypothetical protein K2M36_00770 [Clostridia bacterium]|nr:hypothetical protein [Clostridia bacterium]